MTADRSPVEEIRSTLCQVIVTNRCRDRYNCVNFDRFRPTRTNSRVSYRGPGFAEIAGEALGETAELAGATARGATVAFGATTPALEEGDAEDEAGDVPAGAVCCFISSRRSALSPLVLCAYKIERTKVSPKKIAANQAVILTRTLVVCAPKIFSVTPPPKAAPKPSLRGRCIKITSNISSATIT